MKYQTISSVLAIGLAASISATAEEAEKKAAEEKPATEATEAAPEPIDPAVVKPNASYGLGYRAGADFGQQYGNFGITPDDIDTENFVKGFFSAFKGEEPGISEEDLGKAMQAFGDNLQKREKELAENNLKAGEAFLAENGKKDGVVTTESGLQYEILEKGGEEKYVEPKEGEAPKQFLVNYRGTLIDGTEFDASPEGQPIPMTLQVIPGFSEALKLMPVGSKWKLFIPSKLAYGEQRRSADIGPNSTLIFELELTKIQDTPAAASMPFQMPTPAE